MAPTSKFWQTAVNNPKSTASGVLSFIAVTSVTLMPFVQQRKAAGVLAVSAALAKAYVLLISKDADKQAVALPDGETVAVPAHSVPDQPLPPGAKIAKK